MRIKCENCGKLIEWSVSEMIYARERIARGYHASLACDDDCAVLCDPWDTKRLDALMRFPQAPRLAQEQVQDQFRVRGWQEGDSPCPGGISGLFATRRRRDTQSCTGTGDMVLLTSRSILEMGRKILPTASGSATWPGRQYAWKSRNAGERITRRSHAKTNSGHREDGNRLRAER